MRTSKSNATGRDQLRVRFSHVSPWRLLAIAFSLALLTAPASRATLIVTAICEDGAGVVIRSDKRSTIKHRSGPTEYRDVLDKVFATEDRQVIIYRMFLSGSGKKYCRRTDAQKQDDHWASLTTKQAKQEIAELFQAAAKRQAEAKGEEFSKEFNELVVAP